MHRYSSLLLVAGLTLAGALGSCVDDIVIREDHGDPIGFYTEVHNHARSSLIHTTQNLDSFHVFAYCPDGTVFFENLHVQKTDPDKITDNFYNLSWDIEGGPYFYPRDAAWVDYYVYRYISGIEGGYGNTPNANGVLPPKLDVTALKQIIHEFKPYDRIENQEDLIIEHKRSYNNEVSGVWLRFHHALSQVELKAYAPNNNVRVVVAGAWFCNIINQGDVHWPRTNPDHPDNGYGLADDELFWVLPERTSAADVDNGNKINDLSGLNSWITEHRNDWKDNEVVVSKPYRSHYGSFFNKPIMLGATPNEEYVAPTKPTEPSEGEGEGDEATRSRSSRADGDDPTNRPNDPIHNGPLHDCTDYDNDGICDHLVYDNDIFRGTAASKLLTFSSDDLDDAGKHRPLNLLVPPQQLVPYNKNRDEDDNMMFYDEESTPNNHGAYILLAIQIYSIHGTDEHRHRHLVFPYNGPEKWNIDGQLINADGEIVDFLGNRLKMFDGVYFPVDKDGNKIFKEITDEEGNVIETVQVDNFGNRVDQQTGEVLDKNGNPMVSDYYTFETDGKGDPNFKWNKTFGWVCIPIDDLWRPGYKYTYILEFMGQNSGAGIYPPDDFDFTDLIEMDHSDDVRNGHFKLPSGDVTAYPSDRPYFNGDEEQARKFVEEKLGYTIIPSQEVRLRDPGTMNSKKKWVGKKQGDPVLSKPIDFRVTVDEWINNGYIELPMESYDGKQSVTKPNQN